MNKAVVWMGILCAVVMMAGQSVWADAGTDAVGRRETLQAAGTSVSATGRWWVFFRGKGIYSESQAQKEAAEYLRSHLSNERRTRAGVSPDGLDLPVLENYVAAVTETGARVHRVSRWLNAVSVYADTDQLLQIEQLPMVAGVAPVAGGVRDGRPTVENALAASEAMPSGTSTYPYNYGLAMQQNLQLNVPDLHALGFTGTGVKIAVFDTGFLLTHNAFDSLLADGRLLAKWDFIFADTSVANDSLDIPGQDRHGTIVLSVITGDANGELIGPALDAQIILAKTEDNASETPLEEDNYVAALEWADSLGADIVTSSLSYKFGYVYDGTQGITSIAASAAAVRGILLCTAMGNSGPAPMTLGAPADAFGIVSVGAVDSFGDIAAFSSRGPTADGRTKPEVCARGVSVTSAEPTLPGTYIGVSGTSLSTPLTSASAALLIQAHPDWAPLQVREALMHSGDHAANPDNTYGWGIFDLKAALDYVPFGTLQLQPVAATDHYDAANWDLSVIPQARLERLPVAIMLHYTYDTGSSDSVAMVNDGDTLWLGTVPFAAEHALRYYYAVTDSLGRELVFPTAAPLQQYELVRLPDSLTDGFEHGGLRWERGGSGGLWSVSAGEVMAGKFALSDSPRGAYPPDADGWMAMKYPLIISGATLMGLSFDTRYQLGAGDTGFVEIQKRPSAGWEIVSAIIGSQSNWSRSNYTFSGSANDSVRARFRLKSDGGTEGDGWYVDNVALYLGATSVVADAPLMPERFTLLRNYPNPFNPATTIEFELEQPTQVRLSVYNVNGQLVRTLSQGVREAGMHRVTWNGLDNRGHEAASGVYFYRLETDIDNTTRKMLLLR